MKFSAVVHVISLFCSCEHTSRWILFGNVLILPQNTTSQAIYIKVFGFFKVFLNFQIKYIG